MLGCFVLFLLLVLQACRRSAIEKPEALFVTQPDRPRSLESKAQRVRILLDATSSMSGFAANRSTDFAGRVHDIEQAVLRGWPRIQPGCYEFGSGSVLTRQSGCHAVVLNSRFQGAEGQSKRAGNSTRLDALLNDASPKSLDLIVTDLYQDDADLGAVLRSAQAHVFDKGMTLGIAAFESAYSGTIYDVGLRNGSARWQGQRPWYVLAVGTEKEIETLFDQFAAAPVSLPRNRMLLFSTALLGKPADANLEKRELRNVSISRDLSPIGSSLPVAGFKLIHDESSIELALPAARAEYRPALRSFDQSLRFATEIRSADKVRSTTSGVSVTGLPEGIRVVFQQKGSGMSRSKVYGMQIRVGFDERAVSWPAFVATNDVSPAAASEQLAKDARAFDGSRTQGLRNLVNGLWALTTGAQGTSLGNIYIYFER